MNRTNKVKLMFAHPDMDAVHGKKFKSNKHKQLDEMRRLLSAQTTKRELFEAKMIRLLSPKGK